MSDLTIQACCLMIFILVGVLISRPYHQCDHSKCYPEPLPRCDHVKCYPDPQKIEWTTTLSRKGDSASDTNPSAIISGTGPLVVPIASYPNVPISFGLKSGRPSVTVPLNGGFSAEVDILDVWNMIVGEKK